MNYAFKALIAAVNAGRMPMFVGEVQLAGWSDSHTGGSKITLWLPDPDELEPFRLMTARKGNHSGQRLLIMAVEINDDESLGSREPNVVTGNEAPEKIEPPKKPAGPACSWLGIQCGNPLFHSFLAEAYPTVWSHYQDTTGTAAERAASAVRYILAVKTRREVDGDARAMKAFDALRQLWQHWNQEKAT